MSNIKQNLHKVINENDDKHLDKFDSILHKVKSTKSCADEGNTEELQELKNKMSKKLEKLDQYAKRIEELEIKFAKIEQPGDQATNSNKLTDLEKTIQEINSKLSLQEEKFVQFEEHLEDMKNVSSVVENYLSKKNKHKIRCSRGGRCMLYNLITTDKSYNLTKVNTD